MRTLLACLLTLSLAGLANAEPVKWPDLTTVPFVNGRVATEADMKSGRAVFYQKGPMVRAMKLTVPQYAWLKGETGKRTAVVLVQAETNKNGDVLGLRDVDGHDYVATLGEVTLLGRERPDEEERR